MIFHNFRQHNDHLAFVLVNHTPEIVNSLGKGS